MDAQPAGHVTDYGDLLHVEQWLVKGRRPRLIWHLGPARDTTAADRIGTDSPITTTPTERTDTIMDLQADKKVTLTAGWVDELGHTTPAPADAQLAYTVDNPDVIALIDNGDGTAVAASTGSLGTATVHVEATAPGYPGMSGDLQLVVVPGLAERINITASEPEEVTPDGSPA